MSSQDLYIEEIKTLRREINTLRQRVSELEHADIAPNTLALRDGVTAPAAATGLALIYVDTADGDLKVRFGDAETNTLENGGDVALTGDQTVAGVKTWTGNAIMREFLQVDRTGGSSANVFQFRARGAAEASNFGNALGNGAGELLVVGLAGMVMGTYDGKPLAFGTNNVVRLTIDEFGRTTLSQPSTTAAVPVLVLVQADLSEELIRFSATVGAGNPINTTALGAYYGRVRVYVEGVGAKWLALYD